MKARFLTIFVLSAITTTSLSAGVVPGRWEKLDVLEPGSKIVLTSKAGDRVRYTFKGSDSNSLTVKDRGSREIVLPKSHVSKVVQQNSRSSKPALIGAAIGGGTGVAMGVASGFGENSIAKWEVVAVTLGLAGAAIGGTIGYCLTDNPPDAVLYQDGPGN